MKIGIIGAGNIGGALAHRLAAVGHDITIANSRGPETLAGVAAQTGARPGSVTDAVRDQEAIVIAIPLNRIPDLPANLFDQALPHAIIIDTGNYYPRQRDGRIEPIESGLTESGWVEQQIGRPVIKVFNSIIALHLREKGRPAGAPDRIALAVAGDDRGSKITVLELLDEIGFDGVDAGTIAESWRQQPGSPGYLKDHNLDGVREALAQAREKRTPQWSGTAQSPGSFAAPA